MKAGGALDDHAAVVIIAGDLRPLALLWHHKGARLRRVVETPEAPLLIGVMRRRPGADKAPALLPRAPDPFFLDQALDQRESVGGIRQQRVGAFRRNIGGAAGK